MIKINVATNSDAGIQIPANSIVVPKMVHLISDLKRDEENHIVVTRRLAYDIQLFAAINDIGVKPNISMPVKEFPYGIEITLTDEQWNTMKTNIDYGEVLLLDKIENGYNGYTGVGKDNAEII